MTTPILPWLEHPDCTVCRSPAVVVSLYTGRRCAAHAPVFDPVTAVEIARRGLGMGTVMAYVRSGL